MMPAYEVGLNIKMPIFAWQLAIVQLMESKSEEKQLLGQYLADETALRYQKGWKDSKMHTIYGLVPDEMQMIMEELGKTVLRQQMEFVKGANAPKACP